jgi:translation elongation factor EF-4
VLTDREMTPQVLDNMELEHFQGSWNQGLPKRCDL